MKKGKVFFRPIDGSGSLTISWSSRPKGDAVEAYKGNGVGFFSDTGDVLCVIFDEVQEGKDHQTLEFKEYLIEVSIRDGEATYSVLKKKEISKAVSVKRSRRKKETFSK